jgi:hypothetical protein
MLSWSRFQSFLVRQVLSVFIKDPETGGMVQYIVEASAARHTDYPVAALAQTTLAHLLTLSSFLAFHHTYHPLVCGLSLL